MCITPFMSLTIQSIKDISWGCEHGCSLSVLFVPLFAPLPVSSLPPVPPHPPAPAAPKASASHLGRHKADKSHAHVDCTFLDGVEYTTER